jgi:hypothetical protein
MKYISIVWILVIAEVGLPLFAWNFPSATGYIEGFTHKYLAWGRCRIDNTKEALGTKGSRIMLGYIRDDMGRLRPHLWAEAAGKVVDMTYPPERKRKAFAAVDPESMQVVWSVVKEGRERTLLNWANDYLPAFVKADRVSGA